MAEFAEGYVPPIPVGARVRATALSELIAPGSLGVISWTHPWPDMPYRVRWDGYPKEGEVYFGMSDIGFLTKPDEIEQVSAPELSPSERARVEAFGIHEGDH